MRDVDGVPHTLVVSRSGLARRPRRSSHFGEQSEGASTTSPSSRGVLSWCSVHPQGSGFGDVEDARAHGQGVVAGFELPTVVPVRQVALVHGDFPATSWRQFLRTQASTMLACDFFHVDCAGTLKQVYVFFVLEVGGRCVHVLGATTNPNGPWTTPQARYLLMNLGDFLTEFRFLVRDRAGQFTASFDAVFADAGIQVVKAPPRCPRANCFAARFVRTVRAELTDLLVVFGERHLRAVLAEYVRHCSGRRPHRACTLHPPRPHYPPANIDQEQIKRRPVLGGLIDEYERAA